ncbi:hypothetical protein OH491_01825 [Termitidicoccus mucosus]
MVQPLLAKLERRDEPYVAQVPGNNAAWPLETQATLESTGRGRLRPHAIVRDAKRHPLSMVEWWDKRQTRPQR